MPRRRPRARSSSSSARPARPRRPARRRSTRRCARRWPASPRRAPPPRWRERLGVPRRAGLRAGAAAQMKRQRAERGGRRAETLAAWWLRLKGWTILARRVRTPVGEVDLVARRGRIARLRRGQGARDARTRPASRSTTIACAGSPRPPRRSRRATPGPATTSASTPSSSSPAACRATSPMSGTDDSARAARAKRAPMSLSVAVQMDPLESDQHRGRFDLRDHARRAGARAPALSLCAPTTLS